MFLWFSYDFLYFPIISTLQRLNISSFNMMISHSRSIIQISFQSPDPPDVCEGRKKAGCHIESLEKPAKCKWLLFLCGRFMELRRIILRHFGLVTFRFASWRDRKPSFLWFRDSRQYSPHRTHHFAAVQIALSGFTCLAKAWPNVHPGGGSPPQLSDLYRCGCSGGCLGQATYFDERLPQQCLLCLNQLPHWRSR